MLNHLLIKSMLTWGFLLWCLFQWFFLSEMDFFRAVLLLRPVSKYCTYVQLDMDVRFKVLPVVKLRNSSRKTVQGRILISQ